MLGAVGSLSPPIPSTFSLELQVRARLSGPWTASRLSIPAGSPHRSCRCTLPCARGLSRSPPSSCVRSSALCCRGPMLVPSCLGGVVLLLHVLANAPDFVAVRLASCSRAPGASGFDPYQWPSRRSPKLRQPCFSSPHFVWLTGIELHGTLSREQKCPCLLAHNSLSQEEHWSWFGLRLRMDGCMWPMGLASLRPGGVSHLPPC